MLQIGNAPGADAHWTSVCGGQTKPAPSFTPTRRCRCRIHSGRRSDGVPSAPFVDGELLVQFSTNVLGPERAGVFQGLGLEELKRYRLVPGLSKVKRRKAKIFTRPWGSSSACGA